MAQVYKDIIRLTIDLKTGVKEAIAPIKQADNLSRVLRCQLINNGKPINLKGSQLLLYVIKADFKQCVINGVINEGKTGVVDFELTEQSLILAEEIQCEIVKIDEGDVLLSFPIFKIGIDGALYDNELVESTNEFSALTALISNVASWENRFVGECERIEEKFDGKIGDVNTQLLDKTSYDEVREQIALAKLQGTEVDTTNFLMRSDLDYLLIKSINKFNSSKLTKDKYLVRGVLTDYVGWNTTEYIRVQGSTMSCKIFKTAEMGSYVKGDIDTWVEVNNVYFAFYDSTYNYITGGSADTGSYLNQVVIPENAKYIRFSQSNKLLNDSSTLMFAFNDLSHLKTVEDFQKYSVELDGSTYIKEDDLEKASSALSKSVTVKSINRLGYDVYNSITPPEHSLEGYTLALKYGFDEILCDLRSTSDSIGVCLHDATINRTARNVDGSNVARATNILDITYDMANTYDYGLYKNSKYKGTELLTLERAVKFAKMNGVTLHIETKCGTTEVEMKMIENAVRTVKKYNMSKFVSWSATYGNIGVLQKIISLDKYANVAIMPDTMTNERFDALLKLKTGFNRVFWFAWETSTIDDDMLNRFINNEVELEIGTINDCNEMKKLFDSNLRYVTAISSDKLVARECLK